MTSGFGCALVYWVCLRAFAGLNWCIGNLILGVIFFEHRTADGPKVSGWKKGGM
jgi:hypothetical protein